MSLPGPTPGRVRFCPALGGQAGINSAHLSRLRLLGIPLHPGEPDPACRRNLHDAWRRPDKDVAVEDDAAAAAMA